MEERPVPPRDKGHAAVPRPEAGGLRQVQQALRADPQARQPPLPPGPPRPLPRGADRRPPQQALRPGHPHRRPHPEPVRKGHRVGVLQAEAADRHGAAQDVGDGQGGRDVCGAGPHPRRSGSRHGPRLPRQQVDGGLCDLGRHLQDQEEDPGLRRPAGRLRPHVIPGLYPPDCVSLRCPIYPSTRRAGEAARVLGMSRPAYPPPHLERGGD